MGVEIPPTRTVCPTCNGEQTIPSPIPGRRHTVCWRCLGVGSVPLIRLEK